MSMQTCGELMSMGTHARGSPTHGSPIPTSLSTHPMEHPCPQADTYQSTCVYVSMSFHSHGEPTPSTLVMGQPSPGIPTIPEHPCPSPIGLPYPWMHKPTSMSMREHEQPCHGAPIPMDTTPTNTQAYVVSMLLPIHTHRIIPSTTDPTPAAPQGLTLPRKCLR